VAADPSNHVAMALQPVNASTFNPDGGAQIGSFTSAANGDLSTTNTAKDMPVSAVGTLQAISMSYSGKLLAVGGTNGLQILHWNGAAAPTAYTGLLTKDPIAQMFWDKDNHLYAISTQTGKLRVYTITPSSHAEAPGSPHALSAPQALSVQVWPPAWSN
jgi:hypothetical protein